jgi:hypothetical protein
LQAIVPIGPATGVGEEHAPVAVLTSLHAEMQQPPGWAATALRLAAFEQALIVTAAFSDPGAAAVVAVTVAILRPDAFRLTASSPHPALSNALLPTALAECADHDDQPGYAGSEAVRSPLRSICGSGRSRTRCLRPATEKGRLKSRASSAGREHSGQQCPGIPPVACVFRR